MAANNIVGGIVVIIVVVILPFIVPSVASFHSRIAVIVLRAPAARLTYLLSVCYFRCILIM